LSAGLGLVAGQTERFEILEMVQATQATVSAAGLTDVIHLKAIGFAQALIFWARTRRRFVAATFAAIAVTPFGGAARQRPPMVVPEAFGTAIAAPHFSSRR
jgi:hypothetical protein